MNRHWNDTDIPDLRGKTAVVTGASTGLGFETAMLLSAHDALVRPPVTAKSPKDAVLDQPVIN